jgi:hypothetical protein
MVGNLVEMMVDETDLKTVAHLVGSLVIAKDEWTDASKVYTMADSMDVQMVEVMEGAMVDTKVVALVIPKVNMKVFV